MYSRKSYSALSYFPPVWFAGEEEEEEEVKVGGVANQKPKVKKRPLYNYYWYNPTPLVEKEYLKEEEESLMLCCVI